MFVIIAVVRLKLDGAEKKSVNTFNKGKTSNFDDLQAKSFANVDLTIHKFVPMYMAHCWAKMTMILLYVTARESCTFCWVSCILRVAVKKPRFRSETAQFFWGTGLPLEHWVFTMCLPT